MKKSIKFISLLLIICLSLSMVTGCSGGGGDSKETSKADAKTSESAEESEESEEVKEESSEEANEESDSGGSDVTNETISLGVIVYSTTDSEVLAFKDYYVDYIAPNFNVEFIYSEAIDDADAEIAFIENVASKGGKGIIAFTGINRLQAIARCQEYDMFYVIGAGTPSDDELAEMSGFDNFLGCTGPTMKAETEIGQDMVKYLSGMDEEKDDSYLIISGGSAMGNEMHYERTRGFLLQLQEEYGLSYGEDVDVLARYSEAQELPVEGDISVYIYPTYPTSDSWFSGFGALLNSGDYDVVLNTMAAALPATLIQEAENNINKDIRTGSVDCFTEDNMTIISAEDISGGPSVNFLAGKYGSIIGPAFASMYNAVTGGYETLRDPDTGYFKLSQGYWVAHDKEEYASLYDLATDADNIAYSAEDLKSVITAFNPDATYEEFAALAEASGVEDAMARRGQ